MSFRFYSILNFALTKSYVRSANFDLPDKTALQCKRIFSC